MGRRTFKIASARSAFAEMMDSLLYLFARTFVAAVAAMPLPVVAWLGRAGGTMVYLLDARHRRVALRNLGLCFASKSPAEIRGLAIENFRRIGENYASAVKTASMSAEAIRPHFDLVGAEKILGFQTDRGPQSRIVAIGHFGNFELYARFGQFVPGFKCAATYRALRQPSINRVMQSLREKSGCRFFERRTESRALKAAMSGTGLLLGLLADQHAGHGARRTHFLGRDCSTSAAPAVLALRYGCPLHTAVCYRIGLGRWRIEVGDEIPTRGADGPRSIEAITEDINRAFEVAVRRDPANWFWVHNRWKAEPMKPDRPQPPLVQPEPAPVAKGG